MSKTNHTSYGAAATSERELTEDDLALVSGGNPKGGESASRVPQDYNEGSDRLQLLAADALTET